MVTRHKSMNHHRIVHVEMINYMNVILMETATITTTTTTQTPLPVTTRKGFKNCDSTPTVPHSDSPVGGHTACFLYIGVR